MQTQTPRWWEGDSVPLPPPPPQDPASRITLAEVKVHAWITEEGANPLLTRKYAKLDLVNTTVLHGGGGAEAGGSAARNDTADSNGAVGDSSRLLQAHHEAGGSAIVPRRLPPLDGSEPPPADAALGGRRASVQTPGSHPHHPLLSPDEVVQAQAHHHQPKVRRLRVGVRRALPTRPPPPAAAPRAARPPPAPPEQRLPRFPRR